MPIPHLVLRDREDRSWTYRLLDLLAGPEPSVAEREAIAGSLTCLEDPRATAPLLALLTDVTRSDGVREAAGTVLRGNGNPPPGPSLRAWWRGDDRVLKRHALLSMGRAEADLLSPVLASPAHPLHLEAIMTAEFGFDEPRFLEPRIAALDHPDARVRWAAATALVWNEPCAAEEPLLRCALDADVGVAIAAIKTLEHYPSRAVMLALSELVNDARAPVAAEAVEVLENLRQRALAALIRAPSSERATLCAWLDPVWSMLAFTSEDLVPSRLSAPARPSKLDGHLRAAEVIALFGDADGPWAEKKSLAFTLDPEVFSAADRALLTPFLTQHADPWVRERAAHWLAAWGDHATLQWLAREDEAFGVRKSAVYGLGLVAPVPAVAAFAWEHLHAPGTTSTHADETLRTYVAHAPNDEAIPRLLALAQTDARETVRTCAIEELCLLDARSEIARLLPRLEQPPLVTWSVHLALLDAVTKLELPLPALEALRLVDHLDVQSALSPFDPENQ
jgi:HEAT repeat protein